MKTLNFSFKTYTGKTFHSVIYCCCSVVLGFSGNLFLTVTGLFPVSPMSHLVKIAGSVAVVQMNKHPANDAPTSNRTTFTWVILLCPSKVTQYPPKVSFGITISEGAAVQVMFNLVVPGIYTPHNGISCPQIWSQITIMGVLWRVIP